MQGLLIGESDSGLRLHPVCIALQHVRALPWASEIVVGVTSANELHEIVDCWNQSSPFLVPEDLASTDLNLLDPRRWS